MKIMNAVRKSWMYGLVLLIAASGCGPGDVPPTTLSASLTLWKGRNLPAEHFQVFAYDWIVKFNDGSVVASRFQDPSFVTDAAGKLSFTRAIALHSGRESWHCKDVCVSWHEEYEGDYCSGWYYDEETGEEYCVEWSEGGYYDVCDKWVEDCDPYYPRMRTAAIVSTWSELTYVENASTYITLMSEKETFAAQGNKGNELWEQIDEFYLPPTRPVSGSGKQLTRSRARQAAVRVPFEQQSTLSPTELELVKKARANFSAAQTAAQP